LPNPRDSYRGGKRPGGEKRSAHTKSRRQDSRQQTTKGVQKKSFVGKKPPRLRLVGDLGADDPKFSMKMSKGYDICVKLAGEKLLTECAKTVDVKRLQEVKGLLEALGKIFTTHYGYYQNLPLLMKALLLRHLDVQQEALREEAYQRADEARRRSKGKKPDFVYRPPRAA